MIHAPISPLPPSKIKPPLYHIPLLQRESVMELLDRGADSKCTLIHAPAGYGKTTALYQWSVTQAEHNKSCFWVCADEEERDPSRLLYCLLCSLIAGGGGDTIESVASQSSFFSVLDQQLLQGEVVNRLNTLMEPAVIIIDDYHLAESDENDKVLESLIAKTSEYVRIVISARQRPAIRLTLLKSRGLVQEIGIDDLKFSAADSDRLLQGCGDSRTLNLISAKTEGWPVALQLAKLWLEDHQYHSGEAKVGPIADMAEYLSAELLKKLPEDTCDTLIQTSILKRVNGDIANAICGRTDCWDIFKRHPELNPLLVPLSTQGGWFRYHHLFAEVLQQHLAIRGETKVRRAHCAAAEWYRNQGNVTQAVDHACKAGEEALAADIIESFGAVRLALTDGMPLSRRLIGKLNRKTVYSHPRIHLASIWQLAKDGDIINARSQYEEFVAKHPVDRNQRHFDDLTKETLFVGLMLREVYQDRNFSPEDILQVETLANSVSQTDHWYQGWVNNLLCIMHIRRGQVGSALAVNETANFHYRQAGSGYGTVFMLLHRAIIHLLAGHLSRADDTINQAIDRAEKEFYADVGLLSLLRIIKSEVYFEQNQLRLADTTLGEALNAAEKSEGWVEIYVRAYHVAAQIANANLGLEAALTIVERALLTADKRDLPRLAWHGQCWLLELYTLNGDLARAADVVARNKFTRLPVGEVYTWREYSDLAVALARLDIAEGAPEKALERLQPIIGEAVKYGRQRAYMELTVVLALAHNARGDRDNCVSALKIALANAVPEGFRRLFVREGAPMARMLKSMIRHVGVAGMQKASVDFLAEILSCLNLPEEEHEDAAQSGIFSDKELAVLRELKLGHVNKVISRNLDISVATVKFHLGNIYRKLGVSSRSMAVAVARRQGVL